MQMNDENPYAVQVTYTDMDSWSCSVVGEHPFKTRDAAEKFAGIFNSIFENSQFGTLYEATVM